jgi:hypothetical protein
LRRGFDKPDTRLEVVQGNVLLGGAEARIIDFWKKKGRFVRKKGRGEGKTWKRRGSEIFFSFWKANAPFCVWT